jgi:single-strand DNA-binding protein
MSVNKVILIGNVGANPEIKTFDNGNKVAGFTMATSESYKDKQGEKVTTTEWHNCKVYGNLCNVVENYIKKGSKLFIEGKIKTTKTDEGKYFTNIIVLNLTMLDSKPSQETNNQNNHKAPVPAEIQGQGEGNLPF